MTPEEISRWTVAVANMVLASSFIVVVVALTIWVVWKLLAPPSQSTRRDRRG